MALLGLRQPVKAVRGGLFIAALGGLSAGCWLAWAPLGLIVPSAVVLGALIYSQVRVVEIPKDKDGA